jgi:hypothetical protein
MAKMFYTLEETKAALGQTEDQIKSLTREGRLREFRDGPRLMFKADQVDALKSQIGGGIEIADSGAPIGLADTRGGSGTGLNLTEHDTPSGSGLAGISGSGLGSGLTGGAGSGMMNLKEDTALAADLGLSGTVGGIPSPGRSGSGAGSAGSVAGGSVSGSRQGINVFGDDTHMPADPMAQTAMPGAGTGSMADLNLEGIGSGSGLLDLTRESDETSLGAELLDEISPGSGGKGGRPLAPPDTGSMAGVKLDAPRGGVVRGTMGVQTVEARDSWAGAFGGMALGTALFLLFAVFALVTAVLGAQPDAVAYFADKDNALLLIFGMGAAVSVVFLMFGYLIGKSVAR